jgi:hypothetical protein
MTTRRSYNADSITRALDVHLDAGRIRNWQGLGNGRFVVSLHRADDLELRSLREAYVFVAGLASAHMAPEQGSPEANAARWERIGREAFAAGRPPQPTADPLVFDAVAHLPVGGGAVEIMSAWTRGYTAANLAAPVEVTA